MTWQWIVVCTSFVLLSFVNKSSAIHCYYCNSANNSACLDFSQYDAEEVSRIIPIVNCEIAIPSPVHVNFFCRKIIQTIYHSEAQSNVRVTRGCGWVSSHKPCYQANNRDHLETVCQCFDDMCNAAEHVDPSTATVMFLLFASILYFFRD